MSALTDIGKIRSCLSKTIRSYLAGVSFECPFEGGNPTECICHELRKKPKKERTRIIEALTDEECFQIFDRHQKCFREKSRSLEVNVTAASSR
jgi:hypothetical protein